MTTIKQLYFSDYKAHLIDIGMSEPEDHKVVYNALNKRINPIRCKPWKKYNQILKIKKNVYTVKVYSISYILQTIIGLKNSFVHIDVEMNIQIE